MYIACCCIQVTCPGFFLSAKDRRCSVITNDAWTRVGALINATVGEPEVAVYTSVFPSLTVKDITKAVGIPDHAATHTE